MSWFSKRTRHHPHSNRRRAPSVEELDDRKLLSASPLGLDSAGYPNPFEDDDLGPIGPIAQVSELADQMLVVQARGVGGLGYPAPDDDGGWGPIGPIVKDLVAEMEPDPTPWIVFKAARQFRTVVEANPEPQPWLPSQTVDAVMSTSLGDGLYYPNPEEDDDFGPLGPVVKQMEQIGRGR